MNNQNQTEHKKSNILFVADLPKDTTYDDLSNFFKNYHFQFATLNNSKVSNIWAQVYFEDDIWAKKARHELNGEILKPELSKNVKGKPIRICNYEGRGGGHKEKKINQSLLVKNIDTSITQKEFYNIFLKYGDIESAKLEYDENGVSKGYGYIYYSNEKEAEEAKKNLNGKEIKGKQLNIVNLVYSNNNQGKNLTLFVVNFPLNFTDIDLRKLFEKYGNIIYASVIKDQMGNSKGVGFITFSNFEETSKCISDTKTNQITFPGLPPLCVKYATKKEEREKRANFTNNNNSSDEYKVQFNLLYQINDIKNEYDLEKEIRLFIKVVMLQEYSPKEVEIDLSRNSGIVTLAKLKDYELFMQKYNEFCMQRQPEFECIPISFEETIQQIPNQNYLNNTNKQINQYNMYQTSSQDMNAPLPGMISQNMNKNYMNPQSNYIQMNNEQNNNNNPNNNYNNFFPNMILVNGKENFMMSNQNNNNNFNNFNIQQQQNMMYNNQNNFQNINNNIRRKNNNFNNNKFKMNPNNITNNINFNKFSNNPNQNFQQQNMIAQQTKMMMMMQNQNRPVIGNFPNINQMPIPIQMQPLPFMYNPQRQNIFIKNQNEKNEEIDQRNLQLLNPSQLQSQFKYPPNTVYNREMIDSKENEEISNEIADSIYEIVCVKHPDEAAKITGMIKEMGIEKMNMLLSKEDDLIELIEKAYEMIKNDEVNY